MTTAQQIDCHIASIETLIENPYFYGPLESDAQRADDEVEELKLKVAELRLKLEDERCDRFEAAYEAEIASMWDDLHY